MGYQCQAVDAADQKGGRNHRHGGVELGIVFLPDEAHISNECNGDLSIGTALAETDYNGLRHRVGLRTQRARRKAWGYGKPVGSKFGLPSLKSKYHA